MGVASGTVRNRQMGAGLKSYNEYGINNRMLVRPFPLNVPVFATINVPFFSRTIAYLCYLQKRFELSWPVLLVIGSLVVLMAALSYWL
jgi:hypothetical protein